MAFEKLISKLKHPGESLKWRAIQGSVFVLGGEGYMQGLRLVGNVIMTRLLFPEAFGLMVIVNLVMLALTMLSDVGVRGAVVLKSAGREERFLDTAWTMQMLRGLLLMVIAVGIAYPIAAYKDEPELAPLIMLASCSAILTASTSPHMLVAERDVKLIRVTIIRVVSSTLAMIATIVWLMIHPTVWALAGYQLIAAGSLSVLSFFAFRARLPRFAWDKEIVSEIFHFGKWIFISTGLTFLGLHGDRAIIATWITTSQLGVFSIAVTFSKILDTVLGPLTTRLFFPVFAELKRSGTQDFAATHRRVRLIVFGLTLPVVLGLSTFGDTLIQLLYDPRYHGAGWMLQVMGLGALASVLIACLQPVALAHENSYLHMRLQATRVALLLICMTAGGYFYELPGLISGIAAAPMLYYPIQLLAIRQYGVRVSLRELAMTAVTIAIIVAVWSLRGWPVSFSAP